jgi:hypothetical protein
MAELAVTGKTRRLLFSWVPEVLFHPGKAFQKIASEHTSIWITPLLLLSILALANTLLAGKIKSQAALSGEITYPPDFQYYSPEQQAQYVQAIQSTQGPVFVYILPAITTLLGVWIGWLILGGLLHLATTLFGGRGTTAASMNIVAWASLPLALRSLVQIIYLIVTKQIITSPGLSGFSPTGDTGILIFLSEVLQLIDIYILWQIMLVILGVKLSTALNTVKSIFSAVITFVLIIALQAGLAYALSLLGNLSITRPFFF